MRAHRSVEGGLVSHDGHQIIDQGSRLLVRPAGKISLRLLSSAEWKMLKPWGAAYEALPLGWRADRAITTFGVGPFVSDSVKCGRGLAFVRGSEHG
ncbi:hypothetical protein LMTR13_23595 [Bradyrhizobium icense]|uniref:Uncharacterized protein n=1 Tax=Bradyrhizobium icense TaxID=1274631 RepID=A0A1B1UJ73_9BRAD|nr:hypothetical protein LMTR13_23595 [Bradyrhizobium icense]